MSSERVHFVKNPTAVGDFARSIADICQGDHSIAGKALEIIACYMNALESEEKFRYELAIKQHSHERND